MEVALSLVIIGAALVYWLILYIKNINTQNVEDTPDLGTHDKLCDYVLHALSEALKDIEIRTKTESTRKIIVRAQYELAEACLKCLDGEPVAIKTVKGPMSTTIKSLYSLYPDQMALLFNFDQPETLTPEIKLLTIFEVLRYHPKTGRDGVDCLSYIIHKYNLDRVRYEIEDGTVPSYRINDDDLNTVFNAEVRTINFEQRANIVTNYVYAHTKGFGVLDEIRKQNINGFNIGASGSVIGSSDDLSNSVATASIWIQFEGKYIHLAFLDAGTAEEVKRIVTLLCRYNNPGPLTERRGFVVNTMYDHSRVLALRPSASEYWACFVRKFAFETRTLDFLLDPPKRDEMGNPIVDEEGNKVSLYHNTFLPKKLIQLFMSAKITTAFTGRQSSGKTTLMSAAIKAVDGRYTVRVLELAPELYLREMYPGRNILSVAETPYVTAQMLQDALKKSDAALSIVGEVATDVVAQRMLQMGQVASIFTIFSHHAVTTEDLVNAITNSVVAAGGGSLRPETVMPQVLEVIKMDVHLDFDTDGNRYIERITEIVRLDNIPYPEQENNENLSLYDIRLRKEYYTRMTDRKQFITRDIIRFDRDTFTYYVNELFSDRMLEYMMHNLETSEKSEWREWIIDTWSGRYDISCCDQYREG